MLPVIKRLFGPYLNKNGRIYVIREYEDGSRKNTAFARHLLEVHLNRELVGDETADHINEDPTDDRIENIQLLRLLPNIYKNIEMSGKKTQMGSFVCEGCEVAFERPLYDLRHQLKYGFAGVRFCGHKCSQKHRSVLGHTTNTYTCPVCAEVFELSVKTVAAQKRGTEYLGFHYTGPCCSETCAEEMWKITTNSINETTEPSK